jgi:hypothetical protein
MFFQCIQTRNYKKHEMKIVLLDIRKRILKFEHPIPIQVEKYVNVLHFYVISYSFFSFSVKTITCIKSDEKLSNIKRVTFDKKMSRYMARRLIAILPFVILGTLIHEPIQHRLVKDTFQRYRPEYHNHTKVNTSIEKFEYVIEYHVMCILRYCQSIQNYDTFILFFHLMAPFIANLFSASYIIFGTARQRSAA